MVAEIWVFYLSNQVINLVHIRLIGPVNVPPPLPKTTPPKSLPTKLSTPSTPSLSVCLPNERVTPSSFRQSIAS